MTICGWKCFERIFNLYHSIIINVFLKSRVKLNLFSCAYEIQLEVYTERSFRSRSETNYKKFARPGLANFFYSDLGSDRLGLRYLKFDLFSCLYIINTFFCWLFLARPVGKVTSHLPAQPAEKKLSGSIHIKSECDLDLDASDFLNSWFIVCIHTVYIKNLFFFP